MLSVSVEGKSSQSPSLPPIVPQTLDVSRDRPSRQNRRRAGGSASGCCGERGRGAAAAAAAAVLSSATEVGGEIARFAVGSKRSRTLVRCGERGMSTRAMHSRYLFVDLRAFPMIITAYLTKYNRKLYTL